MNVSQALAMFLFPFLEGNFLFWSQKCRNLRVRFRQPSEHALHRLVVNGFHIRAGLFDDGLNLRELLIGQMQDGL